MVEEVPDIFMMSIMKRNGEEAYIMILNDNDNVSNIDNAVHCYENFNDYQKS